MTHTRDAKFSFNSVYCSSTCHKTHKGKTYKVIIMYFFLLVSHLRLSQRIDDPVVGWHKPLCSIYLINFSDLFFGCIFRSALCVLSRWVFQPALGCSSYTAISYHDAGDMYMWWNKS